MVVAQNGIGLIHLSIIISNKSTWTSSTPFRTRLRLPSSGSWGSVSPSSSPVLLSSTRLRSSIRNCQGWHWYQQYLYLETRSRHEITDPCCHGWYSGYLRYDRGCHHCPEKYSILLTKVYSCVNQSIQLC